MATFYLSVTASSATASADISAGSSNTFIIDNPLPGGSYFTFETVRNSNGFYDSSSPKNMQGTYTINNGIATLVQSNYISAVAVDAKSTGSFTFVPTNNIVASTLRFLGTAAGEGGTISGADTGSSFTGILDTYTQAIAGYSLRQLKTSATASIRVRRASDDQEQDIGFVDNKLDTGSLATFCSGTNGFVKTFYDQQGSYNLTQTTSTRQPKIYDSSTGVVIKNGEYAMYFDGSDDIMTNSTLGGQFNTSVNANSNLSIFTVFSATWTPIYGAIWELGSSTDASQYWSMAMQRQFGWESVKAGAGGQIFYGYGSLVFSSSVDYEMDYINAGTDLDVQANQIVFNNSTVNNPTWTALDRFSLAAKYRGGSLGDYNQGWYKEVLVFETDQTSNRAGIQSNINTYYSLY